MKEIPEWQENKKEKYRDYVILGIGEGGGYSSNYQDTPISRYETVQDKIKQGATYLSVEKLDKKQFQNAWDILKELYNKILGIKNNKKNDINRNRYLKSAKSFQKINPGIKRKFVVGDMIQLPLVDESVNEIWLENVLSLVNKGKGIVLKELLRVLKRKGIIYVVEYMTPSEVKNYLEEYGFGNKGVDIKIFSGMELIDIMHQLGLSERDFDNIIRMGARVESTGVDSAKNIFLAEIRKK